MLRVEHHRQLFGTQRVPARYDCARMRPVWNSARMERNRGRLDSAARSEISADVKQDLIGLDVVVYPRDFHGLRMCIEHARSKCAHDVSANLERLMDWRRLVHRAGNWFEILRVKCERINEPIPADDVERMMRHRHHSPARAVFDQNFRVAFFVYGVQLSWPVQIALGIRRTHFNLALLI